MTSAQTPPLPASPDRLETHVRTLAETFVPRDAAHPGMLDRVANYIRTHFEAATDHVADQPYDVDAATYRNVCARFGPQRGASIVVGAHYDAAGPYPGADDNASGVAGLLELARCFGAEPPPVPLELVAYPLEEPPFFGTRAMGSAVHARSLRRRGVDVRAMMALEMIGYFTDAPDSQRVPLFLLRPFYPSTGNFIAVVGSLFQRRLVRVVREAMRDGAPLPVHSINAPRLLPGVALSDHRNYWDAGYPAVMITDTAFYRNPHYHTPADTPDTLDYPRMAMVVEGVCAAVYALADA